MKAMRAVWPAAPLVADERLRLLPRAPALSIPARTRGAALATIVVVHAALIAFVLYRDSADLFLVPEQEIPVEVVAEVPPDPPKPPEPQPQPKPEENYDKPAYSAPRAANETAANDKGVQKETDAPQAQSRAQEGSPVTANNAAPAPQVTASALRGAAPERIADEQAEPLEPASPTPDPNAGEAAAAAMAQQTSSTDLMRQLSAQPVLSNFSFAARTTLAPLTGGNEDNRFMSNVFAKILSKKRYPKSAAARHASGTVMVSFIIDGEGALIYQTISHSSGEPDLDAEAVAAVKAAAPYPPPPPGAPRTLLATLKF
ncbi:MAG: TonB family protein [Methylobacteriaceae bacterium]|nr:TonB family protein [Methylobacteriaceae bacterium]